MRSNRFKFLLPVAALLLLAACTALPRPFAHDNSARAPNGLARLVDAGGIRVEIDPDLPESITKHLKKEIVRGLSLADVPASTRPDFTAASVLKGTLDVNRPSLSEPEEINFKWQLIDKKGVEIGSFDQAIQGDTFGWLTSDSSLYRVIAEDAGRQIATLLQGDPEPVANIAPPEKPVKRASAPRFFLMDIDGAPGDGNISLLRSLAFIMKKEGAEIVGSRREAEYLVKGFVNVSQPINGENQVAVTWLVTSGDGKELGKVSQNNKVPAGRLDKQWGDMAFAVADGATLGIKGVVVRHLAAKQSGRPLKNPLQ